MSRIKLREDELSLLNQLLPFKVKRRERADQPASKCDSDDPDCSCQTCAKKIDHHFQLANRLDELEISFAAANEVLTREIAAFGDPAIDKAIQAQSTLQLINVLLYLAHKIEKTHRLYHSNPISAGDWNEESSRAQKLNALKDKIERIDENTVITLKEPPPPSFLQTFYEVWLDPYNPIPFLKRLLKDPIQTGNDISIKSQWYNLLALRIKRLFGDLPLLIQSPSLDHANDKLAKATPVFNILACLYYLPRLFVVSMQTINHVIGISITPQEKKLGWANRLRIQAKKNWFRIGNDSAWGASSIMTILRVSLPILTVILYGWDIALSIVRLAVEYYRSERLLSSINKSVGINENATQPGETSANNHSSLIRNQKEALNRQIRSERKQSILYTAVTIFLFIGMVAGLTAASVSLAGIPLIALGAGLIIATCATQYAAYRALAVSAPPKVVTLDLEIKQKNPVAAPVTVTAPAPVTAPVTVIAPAKVITADTSPRTISNSPPPVTGSRRTLEQIHPKQTPPPLKRSTSDTNLPSRNGDDIKPSQPLSIIPANPTNSSQRWFNNSYPTPRNYHCRFEYHENELNSDLFEQTDRNAITVGNGY